MSVHLVLYSNNEPFDTTKRLIIESIHKFTKKHVIIHDYNLEKIKTKEWFTLIQMLPSIDKNGKRDGYYNSWKPFITRDVYNDMKNCDILYYVDCSQYYKTGFTENIDKLCDIASEKMCIAGSIGDDVRNKSYGCCDNLQVWNKIITNKDNSTALSKRHVLNSWYLFKKCGENNAFIDDWVYFTYYTDNDIEHPLVSYHHTGDQSIFNILVVKYNLPVFYSRPIKHDANKDKNAVLNVINNTSTTHMNDHFTYL